jgi:E3 ubiquitin-protein ligase TRIP12
LQVLCGQLLVPDDIYIVDPELHSRLSKFSSIAAAHAEAADMSEVCDPSSLLFSGCPVDELGLTMTVPGYDDLEMVPGGSDIGVTLDNLSEYVCAVRRWTLHTGVLAQLESL